MSGSVGTNLSLSRGAKRANAKSQTIVDAGHTDTSPRENMKRKQEKKIRNKMGKMKMKSIINYHKVAYCKEYL